MGYTSVEQCRIQQQQEHELEKTRKRLSINNSLFCNPSTSRVTNRPLPQPDGSSSKDFTKQLFVDCSIEYELPNAPKIPKNSQPILMIHPGIKGKKKSDGSEGGDGKNGNVDISALPSNLKGNSNIKTEDNSNPIERASSNVKVENNGRTQNGDEKSATKKVCTSSKCSCPEAVQYRKKHHNTLQQQQQLQQKLHQDQQTFVKKEMVTASCDNQNSSVGIPKSFQQQQQQCIMGSKRSYAQAMVAEDNVEQRASNDGLISSAFQYPTTQGTTSDRNFCSVAGNKNSGSSNSSGNHEQLLQRHHRLQQQHQQNHIGNSSRSGKTKKQQ